MCGALEEVWTIAKLTARREIGVDRAALCVRCLRERSKKVFIGKDRSHAWERLEFCLLLNSCSYLLLPTIGANSLPYLRSDFRCRFSECFRKIVSVWSCIISEGKLPSSWPVNRS